MKSFTLWWHLLVKKAKKFRKMPKVCHSIPTRGRRKQNNSKGPVDEEFHTYLKCIHYKRRVFQIFTLCQSNTFVGSSQGSIFFLKSDLKWAFWCILIHLQYVIEFYIHETIFICWQKVLLRWRVKIHARLLNEYVENFVKM